MKKIIIYAPSNTVPMSIALIRDICWVAEHHAGNEQTHESLLIATNNGKPVHCFSGSTISSNVSINDVQSADAIFIGAFWGAVDDALDNNIALIECLPNLVALNIPLVAVSNGAFFLAEAGLLQNKEAVVYPPVEPAFRKRYPTVKLQHGKSITCDSNIYCADGIASGCDLIVTIIEKLYGATIARQVSNEFLIGFKRNYSVANVAIDGHKYHQDSQILAAQAWLESEYQQAVSIADLAQHLGMSPRNFSRRFKKATGNSPSEYLLKVRIEVAKDQLTNTNKTIAEIAFSVGFSELSYFSRAFFKAENCQPNVYRQKCS